MKPITPKIDPEIRDLLPKLTDEEYAKLSIKLQMEGCLKPLVVWKETNILLDGHHSLAICEEHKIPYTIHCVAFPTRELAIEWVIDNQLGRRNLTEERRAYYRGKEYLAQKRAQGNPNLVQADGVQTAHDAHIGGTAEILGKKHDVDPATIRRDAAFAQAVDTLSAPAKGAERASRRAQGPDRREQTLLRAL